MAVLAVIWAVGTLFMLAVLLASGESLCWPVFGMSVVGGSVPALAVCFLGLRDRHRMKAHYRHVRRLLAGRAKMCEREFCETFGPGDRALAQAARIAVARRFDVSEGHVHADDDLDRDMRWARFEPWISFAVLASVMPEVVPRGRVFAFPRAPVRTFEDLVKELRQFKAVSDEEQARG